MIRHAVMFGIRGRDGRTPEQEARRLGDQLLELPQKIPYLKHMEVGVNCPGTPDDNAQLILLADFESIEDCAMYTIHPAHVAVAEEIGQVKTSRSCVDYEV